MQITNNKPDQINKVIGLGWKVNSGCVQIYTKLTNCEDLTNLRSVWKMWSIEDVN